jgi:K+-transporting ATPase A subunit
LPFLVRAIRFPPPMILVGALTFMPALALDPIVEHLLLSA